MVADINTDMYNILDSSIWNNFVEVGPNFLRGFKRISLPDV